VVVVGQSEGSGNDNYNVTSQYHPNNDTENPSASINYQMNKFTVQTSEGTGSSIKSHGSLPVNAGDEVKVMWDVTFGTNGTLRCARMISTCRGNALLGRGMTVE
jgi:hypothetical protein